MATIIEEKASKQVKVYPSDHEKIEERVRSRKTIAAQIINEALVALAEKESKDK